MKILSLPLQVSYRVKWAPSNHTSFHTAQPKIRSSNYYKEFSTNASTSPPKKEWITSSKKISWRTIPQLNTQSFINPIQNRLSAIIGRLLPGSIRISTLRAKTSHMTTQLLKQATMIPLDSELQQPQAPSYPAQSNSLITRKCSYKF